MQTIIATIVTAVFRGILAWLKQRQLEQQAALAEELKQHAQSVIEAQATVEAVDAAVVAHQEAQEQVTDIQAQLDFLNQWGAKDKQIRSRATRLRIRSQELKTRGI